MAGENVKDVRKLPSGLYILDGEPFWIYHPPDITAKNYDPVVAQHSFAFCGTGTESGHTVGTTNANVDYDEDGNGNYAFYLRFELEQSESRADQNLTETYKLKYQKNGTGGYVDVTASSSNVQVVAGGVTDGEATTNRITTGAASSAGFLAGEVDEGDGTWDSVTWTNDVTEHTELLISLQVIDADMADGDYLEFRVYDTADGVLSGGYTFTPRMDWSAPVTGRVMSSLAEAGGLAYHGGLAGSGGGLAG